MIRRSLSLVCKPEFLKFVDNTSMLATSRICLPQVQRGLAATLLAILPFAVLAQQTQTSSTKKTQTIAKPNSGSATKSLSKSRQELKTRASQTAAGIRAAQMALTPEQLEIAQQVEVGQVACEFGVLVKITADERAPGYFDVIGKKFTFHMSPVITSTKAIRLEDAKAGAVWLQLANKSMLMSQKMGARLADACQSEAQAKVAHDLVENSPPSLFEMADVKK